jgi:hypothetical protein
MPVSIKAMVAELINNNNNNKKSKAIPVSGHGGP